MFVQGYKLTAVVRDAVRDGPADIAVAYWGHDACRILQLPHDLSGYRIICDARSGFCSAKALGDLIDRGAEIVDLPRLHAKVYRNQTMMVVASANALLGGLPDIEVDLGLEAGFVSNDRKELRAAKRWFDAAFIAGLVVEADALPEIEEIWNRQRALRLPDAVKDRAPAVTSLDGEPIALNIVALASADPVSVADRAGHLDRIRAEPARAAYRHLIGESASLGLKPHFKTGTVPALAWWDERRRYLFSFIPNRSDLLFYLRRPALDIAPDLLDQVRALGFRTKRNSRGEETFRIANAEEAAAVTGWLRGALPLP